MKNDLARILDDVAVVEKENKKRKKRKKTQEVEKDPFDGSSVFSGGKGSQMEEISYFPVPQWEHMDADLWHEVLSYLPVAEIPVLLDVSREIRKYAEKIKETWLSEHMGLNLSTEEHQRREALLGIIDLDEDGNEVLARAGPRMTVSRMSMQTLSPRTWLNDEVINYYSKVVLADLDEEKWMNGSEYRKPSLFYSTYFLEKLFQEKNPNRRHRGTYCYSEEIQRWGRRRFPSFTIFDKKRLFLPRNIRNYHWALVVVDFEEKTITYYDSMGITDNRTLMGMLMYLQDE